MCKERERRTNIKSINQYVESNNMLRKERSAEYIQLAVRTSYTECLKTHL